MTRNKTAKGEDSHGGKSYCRGTDSPEDGVRERRNGIETLGGRCSLEGGGLMLGLVVLIIFAAYLLVSGIVVWLAARWAKKRDRRPWVWGGLAAFAMYNLVFWDLIPTLVMHKYYCATEAGFWVYKTPEQWVKENPGVAETLSLSHLPEQYRVNPNNGNFGDSIYMLPDGTRLVARYRVDRTLSTVEFIKSDGSSGYQLNERIQHLDKTDKSFHLLIRRHDMELIDVERADVLAKYVNFSWGNRNALALGPSAPIRAVGTAYLAGGGSCGIKPQRFIDYVSLFRDKGNH
jgi:hypothetical protein